MVDVITPLQKLDAAVEEFFRETEQLDGGGFITGWVIGASRARVQADDDTLLPMVTGATYAFGPQTSVVNGMGLARYLDLVFDRATRQSFDDN